jgi:cation transport regulator
VKRGSLCSLRKPPILDDIASGKVLARHPWPQVRRIRRERRWPMPYESIADLPKEQVDQYSDHGKEAFLKALNSALETYDGDESRAFAVAHAAAKKAEKSE